MTGWQVFKFDPSHEERILKLVDELRDMLNLASRGSVLELAIERLHRFTTAAANSRNEDLRNALLLDFVVKPSGTEMSTRWKLPLSVPSCLMAMFPTPVFDSPEGRGIRQRLLYGIEKNFAGWNERQNVTTDDLDFEKFTVITIEPIESLGQIYRAVGLFSDAAEALIKTLSQKGNAYETKSLAQPKHCRPR